MPNEFDAAITTYRSNDCAMPSGHALYTARDEETEALDVLTRTPSESLWPHWRETQGVAGADAGRTMVRWV